MLLVVPDGDILPGTVVVDGGTMLRMASLGNTPASGASRSRGVQPGEDQMSRGVMLPPGCHDFRRFSTFFFLSPKRPLIQLHSTMTCFHIPYLILSHVPFLFILSFIFFRSFRIVGKLGHLGLLGLETFGPWEDSTEDYLFWSDVDILS